MGQRRRTGDLVELKVLVEQALEVVTPAGDAEIRRNLGYVLAAVARLEPSPAPADLMIAVSDVCQFLEVRGEGLGDLEFERAVGLPRDIFERLENAAGKQSDLDQIRYGLAGAIQGLGRTGEARRLLTRAVSLGKALDREFADPPAVAAKSCSDSHLAMDDACRVLEQLFRFVDTGAVERATGVPRGMIERMDSAAASAGKRDF